MAMTWNKDKWKKYEHRNFTKISVLHLLQMILDEKGGGAVLSAGQIARLSQTPYNSVRKLLHERWLEWDWECKLKDGTVKVRKGMRLVQEVDCTSLQTSFRWGYRIAPQGISYLAKSADWYPFWDVCRDRVIAARKSADKKSEPLLYTWFETAHLSLYLRPPFETDEDFGLTTDKMLNQPHKFCRGGLEEALIEASKLPSPPSKEFIAYTRSEALRWQRETVR
jgi:hypothetical protein